MSARHHQDDPIVDNIPVKRALTPKKASVLAAVLIIPQIGPQLAYHFASKDDLLVVAMAAAGVASLLGFCVVEVWRMYVGAQQRAEHFRDRLELQYIEIRGFAFSRGFVLSEELEAFIRSLLPDDDEARRYHPGLARGIREARDPETYRRARWEAAAGTRYYITGRSLSNDVVRATPVTSPRASEGEES